MSQWALGCSLNLSGSVLINLGSNVIKLSHVRHLKEKNEELRIRLLESRRNNGEEETEISPPSFRKSNIWFLGMLLFLVGNVLNFISFSYAAQSLLSALGCIQFLTNVAFARIVLGEEITYRALIGTVFIIIGISIVVLFSRHDNPAENYTIAELEELFIAKSYLVYIVFMFLVWLASISMDLWLKKSKTRKLNDGSVQGFMYALISACVGAQSVTFFKILSELLTVLLFSSDRISRNAVIIDPFSYFVMIGAIGTSIFWIYRLNKALEYFDALFIIPLFQVLWVSLSTIGGGIYFQEFSGRNFDENQAVCLASGLFTIFFGVYIISKSHSSDALQSVGSVISSAEGNSQISQSHYHVLEGLHPDVNTLNSNEQNPNLPMFSQVRRRNSSVNFNDSTVVSDISMQSAPVYSTLNSPLSSTEPYDHFLHHISSMNMSLAMPMIDAVHHNSIKKQRIGLRRSDTI